MASNYDQVTAQLILLFYGSEALQEYRQDNSLVPITISQAVAYILSEIQKAKPETVADYDGNDLESACNYYHLAFESWAEVIRFEGGLRQGIDDYEQALTAKFGRSTES